jgi:hypothetical protein
VNGFRFMPDRLVGEREEREAYASRAIAYHNAFLDDALRAIMPHDLVLLGAPTGIGKTEIALSIAASNAQAGNRTHYFALEAEPRELERRTKFALLSREAHRTNHPHRNALNYTDWFLGRCEDIVGEMNAWADREIARTLGQLATYYRGSKFDAADLGRAIVAVHDETTLIVVDHLHYVDGGDDENENRAITDTVKTIREVSLGIGKPIILVVHLRKKERGKFAALIADENDVHGSSNITKIATQLIMLERASSIEPSKWYLSPTFVSVQKDRRAGKKREIALMQFDQRHRRYAPEYTLGTLRGNTWEPIKLGDQPSWAKHHRALDEEGAPSTQSTIHPNAPVNR